MSLFKRVHVVTVPKEFLEEGDSETQLRFSQLTPGKMARANMNDTLYALDRQNQIMAALDDGPASGSARSAESAGPRIYEAYPGSVAEDPDTFDDFDQPTLVKLAHVEYQKASKWTEFTEKEIDELLCLDWLAGEIYDRSKPKSAKEREKNS